MTFDMQVILISNLAIMVITLLGFLVYKLENFAKTKARLNRRIQYLQEMLNDAQDIKSQPRSHDSLQNLQALSQKQLDMADTIFNIEDIHNPEDEKELRQLTVQLNQLKAQIKDSNKLVETLKSDSHSHLHRLTILENKLEQKSEKLEKAIEINQELEAHYKKMTAAYKAVVRKLKTLQESKENLQHMNGENMRLKNQMDEFQQLHEQQLTEIEELKVNNQTQSKSPENEDLAQLEEEFKILQEQLERTDKEKQFLEEQFLTVVESLDDQNTIEEELDRSKKEYSFLEDRFVKLSEKESSKEDATDK